MKTAFSTGSVRARDHRAFWREEASKLYVAHEFSTRVGREFHGKIGIGTLGNIALASFECDECLVMRTPGSLKSAEDDDVL